MPIQDRTYHHPVSKASIVRRWPGRAGRWIKNHVSYSISLSVAGISAVVSVLAQVQAGKSDWFAWAWLAGITTGAAFLIPALIGIRQQRLADSVAHAKRLPRESLRRGEVAL